MMRLDNRPLNIRNNKIKVIKVMVRNEDILAIFQILYNVWPATCPFGLFTDNICTQIHDNAQTTNGFCFAIHPLGADNFAVSTNIFTNARIYFTQVIPATRHQNQPPFKRWRSTRRRHGLKMPEFRQIISHTWIVSQLQHICMGTVDNSDHTHNASKPLHHDVLGPNI